jgi:hypothetical protein
MARHLGYTTSWVTLPILTASLQAKNADFGGNCNLWATAMVTFSNLH